MRRNAAIVARFLLFHFLSVLLTTMYMAVSLETTTLYDGAPIPSLWPIVGPAVQAALLASPILLIPSVVGWWSGGHLLRVLKTSSVRHPMFQGAAAGLVTVLAFGPGIWIIGPILVGIPIGAFVGWLVYCRIWPDLPAPALR